MPKRNDKNTIASILKPKMNYRVEKNSKVDDGISVILSGGYGRSYTNFHSLLSYENYNLFFEPEAVKVAQ